MRNHKGENNPNWKENIKYRAIHSWVRNNKPKLEICEKCKRQLSFELLDLANVLGQYDRNFDNYKWFYKKCHTLFDEKMIKLNSSKRRLHKNGLIICQRCKKFKNPQEFYKDNSNWDKLFSRCKECCKNEN